MDFGKWTMDRNVKLDEKVNAQKVREKVISTLKSSAEKVLIMDSNEAYQDIINMYDILKKLEGLILDFSQIFAKRKKEKNMVDFSDVEHFALKILLDENGNPTEIAKKYQSKFDEIAIDEYQDSNLVQEYILTSISKGNNIFMVGDVKQSIYKFRQARPDLFLSKYKTYKLKQNKTENDDLKIQLFKNFRSRKEVLDFSNLIFSKIMTEELGELNYTEEEYLNLGADYKDTGEDLKTEIDIITIDNKEDEEEPEELEVEVDENEDTQDEEFKTEVERKEDIEVEAMFVANKIKQLIDNKFQVYDAKAKEKRDIKYKDIVVLLRSTKISAPIFEKEIIKLGIPVFSDSSSEYLESLEIQTIMNLLKIIDNPLQEIPLVATMRSTIGGFTDNELVEIRLSDKYDNFYNTLLKSKKDVSEQLRNKINKFLEQIEMWRKEQEYLSLDELIWKIYNDTGYFNYVGLMRNGELRQANLKMLFERAKQCESISFKGLYNFINYIEKIKTSSKDMDSAKIIGENDDVVRIMSIHKSKGLEFPVVILANSGKQFNLQDLNSKILLHPELGIGVKYIDYDMQITYDTLSKRAIKNKMKIETLSEEMRVLYVALTRAKEKIIITGLAKKEKQDKMLENVEKYDELNIMLLSKAKSYLDWITLVHLYYEQTMESLATWNVLQKEDVIKMCATQEPEREENKTDEILKKLNEFKIEDVKANEIQKLLEYQYKYSDATIIPTKTSVTEIKEMKKSALGEKSKKEAENTKMKQYVLREENESENENIVSKVEFPKPKFLQSDEKTEISNAEKGTLIHLCMQKLDINKKEYTIQNVKELVDKLVAKKTITEQEANAINIKKIYQFTKSNIWQEMTEAQVVEREKPFYINIPAQEIYEKDLEEKVLVQGVIDLYYISSNGELVLVDFKTDYVPDKNEQILIERYSSQLQLYKRALESATGKRVDKTYIYSTYLEKEIKI
jgi:ATP-dependent helicase/nuclease subunit A